MICDVCKTGLDGMWDPGRTERLVELPENVYFDQETGWGDETKYNFRVPKQKIPGRYLYGHHKTRDSLWASIKEGCLVCNRFMAFKDRGNRSVVDFSYGAKIYSPDIEAYGYFSVFTVFKDRARLQVEEIVPQMRVFAGIDCCDSELVPYGIPRFDKQLNFDFGPSTNDPITWSRIDNWMKTCLESHAQCMQTNVPTAYRPTRLIELTESKTFRLVNGSDCLPNTQYVALSYCWGSKPASSLLRLLQSTIGRLSREQPIDILPRTFRDAMSIAQHFGIKYIWIDRLCIFQDSAEDWSKEASTMHDVYRYAKFSISALGAEDDDGGCFSQRDPAKAGPTIVRLRVQEEDEESVLRFREEKREAWELSFNREPLLQRSWVVQERLLATRTLYFGSKQVFWECREFACSESHPEGGYDFNDSESRSEKQELSRQRTQSLTSRSPLLWKQLLDAPYRTNSSSEYEQLFMDWNAMIEYYADRQLTQAGDRLIALSGLANVMKARLGQLKPGPHRYLAGLWEEKLLETLVWETDGHAKRSPEYRAPSWSWACVDGNVRFPSKSISQDEIISGGLYQDDTAFSYVVSVETASWGPDDTGKIQGGELTLKGPYGYFSLNKCQYLLSGRREWDSIKAMIGRDGRHLSTYGSVVFDTFQDVRESAIVVWICARYRDSNARYYAPDIMGLVLASLGENTYQRLGTVCYHSPDRDGAQNFVREFSEGEFRIV